LSAVLVTPPGHGTVTLNGNGGFTYSPAAGYSGPDSFTYQANDGATNSGIATVSITVHAVNNAPVEVDDNYSVNEDTTLTVSAPGVLANDTDADGDGLSAVPVGLPSHGAVILNSNGSFSYSPAPGYNGPDSFNYQATDGATNSRVVTVTLTVNPVNDAPVAADDSYNTPEDTTLTVSAPGMLANDSDVDGDPLTAVLVSGPAHGSLSLN